MAEQICDRLYGHPSHAGLKATWRTGKRQYPGGVHRCTMCRADGVEEGRDAQNWKSQSFLVRSVATNIRVRAKDDIALLRQGCGVVSNADKTLRDNHVAVKDGT